MKKHLFILSVLCCLCTYSVLAQNDDREPGLYAVSGEESVLLTYQNGMTSDPGVNFLGIVEVGEKQYSFKGATSDVMADSTFVMVCDMEKKNIVRTLKKYDVFVKTTTPDNLLVVPLEVKNNKRIYSEGKTINGFNTKKRTTEALEWEQISDNSYLITVHNLVPGEYGFIFKPAKLGQYDFTAIFSFTVPGAESGSEVESQPEAAE